MSKGRDSSVTDDAAAQRSASIGIPRITTRAPAPWHYAVSIRGNRLAPVHL